jgi:hypothetical protein
VSAEDGVIEVTDIMTTTIASLVAALAKAQGQMGGAKKDAVAEVQYGTGPVRKRAYADLASVWDAIRAPLSANGIAIIQTTESVQGGICVVTLMAHASGEWIRSRLSMPASKNDAQGYGSALTYARRYSLMAIVGIAPEDDDGEEATRAPQQQRQERAPAPPQNIPKGTTNADKEAASAIAHAMKDAGMAGDRDAVLEAFKGATTRFSAGSILTRLSQLRDEAIALCDAASQKGAAE